MTNPPLFLHRSFRKRSFISKISLKLFLSEFQFAQKIISGFYLVLYFINFSEDRRIVLKSCSNFSKKKIKNKNASCIPYSILVRNLSNILLETYSKIPYNVSLGFLSVHFYNEPYITFLDESSRICSKHFSRNSSKVSSRNFYEASLENTYWQYFSWISHNIFFSSIRGCSRTIKLEAFISIIKKNILYCLKILNKFWYQFDVNFVFFSG